jgi:hypothetical protein
MGEGEPMGQEALKQEIVGGLRAAMTGWKNGIPKEVLYSTSPNSKYKVRKAWFALVAGNLADIIRNVLNEELQIPEELCAEVFAYHEALVNDTEFKDRLTTQEDIDKAEVIINKILVEFEK